MDSPIPAGAAPIYWPLEDWVIHRVEKLDYGAMYQRRATRVPNPVEIHDLTPPYEIGDEIIVATPIAFATGLTLGDIPNSVLDPEEEVIYLDLNVDARTWALSI